MLKKYKSFTTLSGFTKSIYDFVNNYHLSVTQQIVNKLNHLQYTTRYNKRFNPNLIQLICMY
jgi:hypothetical protein